MCVCVQEGETVCVKQGETVCVKQGETVCVKQGETVCVNQGENYSNGFCAIRVCISSSSSSTVWVMLSSHNSLLF